MLSKQIPHFVVMYTYGEVFCMYENLRDLRMDKDLSQKEIANLLHCTQQAYSNYELGQRDIPTAVLIELAQLHKTSIDYLLGLTDERKPYPRKKESK